ncbi:hypothetical protein POM88_039990 [Heracleum sosnowskyi]|uniref:Uncharacterized protein n=1 Tax=Heracleum sosnowskyi TaxID=360622 RepID=A0AAD8M9D0_9APIA|nr:hypothetical protein POM88_039990 [Heracleum sosnowskyi]
MRGEKDLQKLVSVHFMSKQLEVYLINTRPAMLFFIFNDESIGVLVVHDLMGEEFVLQLINSLQLVAVIANSYTKLSVRILGQPWEFLLHLDPVMASSGSLLIDNETETELVEDVDRNKSHMPFQDIQM